jgi:hypothetical protein
VSPIATEHRLADLRTRIANSHGADARKLALLVAVHEILRRRAEVMDASSITVIAEPRRFDPRRWPDGRSEKLDVYERLVQAVRETLPQIVPAGSRVLVVSRGDERMLVSAGLRAEHFPQDGGGGYAGHYPRDGAAAVAHLEALRSAGAEFLALPASAFWWLDHYAELFSHLRPLVVHSDDDVAIYDLRLLAMEGAAT